VQFFEVARERFLKPGGKLIPSSVDLFVTLMECPELFQFTFVGMRDFSMQRQTAAFRDRARDFPPPPQAVQNRGGSRDVCGRGCDPLLAVTDANL